MILHPKILTYFSAFSAVMISLTSVGRESSFAQDIAFDLANKFFETENYEAALTEYQRYTFFNPHGELIGQAHFQIGKIYQFQNQWLKAIDAMRQSISVTQHDSLRDERRISIAVVMMADHDYSMAEFELLRVAHFSNHSLLRKKAFFFLGICYLYTYRWEETRRALDHSYSDSPSEDGHTLDSLLSCSIELAHKSPQTSKWLSTFLPGSGQIYCGDWPNGLNALALNSALGYLFFDALFTKRFQDAFIGFFGLFSRYYRGNRYHAERIAISYNENVNKTFAQEILSSLRQIESQQ
jgi:tetratricopeptide (TPR) repeat protein